MKNKKKLPLLLLALLTLSFGAYGTRAYLTDSVGTQGHVSIDIGTIDIKAADTGWVYKAVMGDKTNAEVNQDLVVGTEKKLSGISDANQAINLGETSDNGNGDILLSGPVEISAARPGDSFMRTITYTNSGNLTQDVVLTIDSKFWSDPDKVDYTKFFNVELILSNDLKTKLPSAPAQDGNYKIPHTLGPNGSFEVGVLLTIKPEIQNTDLISDVELDWLDEAIHVEAKQTNAN